jgi:hypothetical protein
MSTNVVLDNDVAMPALGFGVVGYRLIDTAALCAFHRDFPEA